ncbi:hypothetical protein AVEN_175627-1 [Araneus ventricosus]|uniref:RNA-directed DNA polymerase n=1 Tax=Araneus ventricosus TaxID=182803 RepID=A0A4Y2LU30_ARAVE|nr:hypothetical protein AVEN_175627-1 [Araneus ventricosus]
MANGFLVVRYLLRRWRVPGSTADSTEATYPHVLIVRGNTLDGWYILVPDVSIGRYRSHLAGLLRGSSNSGQLLGFCVKGGRRFRKWPLAYRSWLAYRASTEAGELPSLVGLRVTEVLENADDITSSTGATKLREEQRSCPSLKEAFLQCKAKKGNYLFIYGLLHHTDKILGQPVTQLVLPQDRRQQVLKLAHESVFGAHMGMIKTKERIRYSFYWPGLSQDVEIFCKTCKECQLRSSEKKTDRIPITPPSLDLTYLSR